MIKTCTPLRISTSFGKRLQGVNINAFCFRFVVYHNRRFLTSLFANSHFYVKLVFILLSAFHFQRSKVYFVKGLLPLSLVLSSV